VLAQSRPLLGSYRPLFRSARVRRLVATSLSARLAVGMFGLPMILTVRDATGSYAAAGLVSGAWSVGVAVSSPLRGRLVDRRGSRRALPPLALVSAGALAALPLVGETGSVWALAPVAALSGLAMPPFVASMRVEWQGLLGIGHPRLTQAYAFESAMQVAMFVIGPLVAAAGVALAGPRATLAATAALMLAGGLAFASQAGVEPGADRAPGRSPIRLPGVLTLVLATLLADTALGVADVTLIAFADLEGNPESGGVLIALFAAGSVVGGLLFGARMWPGSPSRQLAAITATASVAMAPLALADSLLAAAPLAVLAGAPGAAQWAAASLTLDRASGGSAGAEAYTWLSTANAVGIAVGSTVAGALVEASGTSMAFLAGCAATAAAAVFLLARRSTID
jgi:predicted MFS family arabinose efflux permease